MNRIPIALAALMSSSFSGTLAPMQPDPFLVARATVLPPLVVTDAMAAGDIASVYFERFIGGCGFNDFPRYQCGEWRSEAHVGYGGSPKGPIRINARTGGVSFAGGPSFATGREFWTAVFGPMPPVFANVSVQCGRP